MLEITRPSTSIVADLPDEARVWIFALSRPLTAEEELRLNVNLQDFVQTWKSHGAQVHGAFEIHYARFVLVAADQEICHVSGCSIDSLVRSVKAKLTELNVPLSDLSFVQYKDELDVIETTRESFAALVKAGTVSPETKVFNNTIQSVAELKAGKWEASFADSWHAKAFRP